MNILEVSGLRKVYTTRFGGNQAEALKNVSFHVEDVYKRQLRKNVRRSFMNTSTVRSRIRRSERRSTSCSIGKKRTTLCSAKRSTRYRIPDLTVTSVRQRRRACTLTCPRLRLNPLLLRRSTENRHPSSKGGKSTGKPTSFR